MGLIPYSVPCFLNKVSGKTSRDSQKYHDTAATLSGLTGNNWLSHTIVEAPKRIHGQSEFWLGRKAIKKGSNSSHHPTIDGTVDEFVRVDTI